MAVNARTSGAGVLERTRRGLQCATDPGAGGLPNISGHQALGRMRTGPLRSTEVAEFGGHETLTGLTTLPGEGKETGSSAHVLSDLAKVAVSKGLNCMHLNVRSLLPKVEEFHLFAFNAQAGVICITESWLDPSVSDS